MSNNSQLGWILAVGGLGIAGYYYFNKTKPKVSEEQLKAIDEELGTIKAKSEEKSKTPDELMKEAIDNIQKISDEEKKSLAAIDFSKMDFSKLDLKLDTDLSGINRLLGNTYELKIEEMDKRVEKEFPLPIPLTPTDAYVCIKLDVLIRDITLKIQEEQSKVIQKKGDQQYVDGLQRRKSIIELHYSSSSCPIKIENLRVKESGALLTKGLILSENEIVDKSNTDQQIFIGVGAVVAIAGLYIILKNN